MNLLNILTNTRDDDGSDGPDYCFDCGETPEECTCEATCLGCGDPSSVCTCDDDDDGDEYGDGFEVDTYSDADSGL